jgi:hypothetical protein
VSANEEVSKNAASACVALFAAALSIGLESTTGSAPNRFIEVPVNRD